MRLSTRKSDPCYQPPEITLRAAVFLDGRAVERSNDTYPVMADEEQGVILMTDGNRDWLIYGKVRIDLPGRC